MTHRDRRLEAVIRGRVQGVGFRHFVRRRARELELGGWVRNRPDGTVEAVAEGPEASLLAFLGVLKSGPPSARVESVREIWTAAQDRFASFEIVG